ncbi:MAG: magnesium transporter [Candidatus Bathyarchaeia archaeon]
MSNNTSSSQSHQDSFSKTFKECVLSFNFDFVGLIAGLVLASQIHIFKFSPWVVAIYPAILSAKGMIAGMLTGRLSTALHVGTVYPKFIGNTRSFYKLFDAIIVITLITSLFMSLVATVIGMLFWGIEIENFTDIMLIVMATMALGLTISLITMLVSFASFTRGLDPDVVVYPVMSTTADVIITVYYIIIVNVFFIFGDAGKIVVALIVATYLALVFYMLLRNIEDKEFIRNIKEVILTLIIVAFIVNFTGTFLGKISAIVEERREVYTVYPALIDMIGDVGSVVGSVATTKLALGLLNPSLSAIKRVKAQIFSSWLASLIIFVILSFLSLALNIMFNLSTFIDFVSILLMTNIIAVPMIILISFAVSILTFKGGFDPDNFVIPIESSLADNITTVALFLVLFLLQLG